MQIKHLEQKNQSYRNIKLSGLTIKAFLNGIANAGAENIDFSKATIQVILTRANQSHVIAQNNLKVLGLASSIDSLNQAAFADTIDTGFVLTSATTSMVSFLIPFGGIIDLEGDDEIYIEVVNNAGLFGDPALFASSYLEIKPVKAVGVERFIPRIRAYVIQANETANQYMLEDNLIRLAIINFDKTSFLNNVVNNLIFSSATLDETYTFSDLIANKISRYGRQLLPHADADLSVDMQQDQSFVLTDFHQEFDAVVLDMQFNSANVNASCNYIVAWNYSTSWTILAKADAKNKAANAVTTAKINAVSVKGK
ncbi:MAG TPA: hypothetical protein VIL78_00695 [Hanamia sp.]